MRRRACTCTQVLAYTPAVLARTHARAHPPHTHTHTYTRTHARAHAHAHAHACTHALAGACTHVIFFMKLAVYGKGGIGKSTASYNISIARTRTQARTHTHTHKHARTAQSWSTPWPGEHAVPQACLCPHKAHVCGTESQV